jgi:hypothetical protein
VKIVVPSPARRAARRGIIGATGRGLLGLRASSQLRLVRALP